MRLQLDTTSKIKNYIHIGQAILIALSILLMIAIFTRNGKSDGRVGWYFGLVCLTLLQLLSLLTEFLDSAFCQSP